MNTLSVQNNLRECRLKANMRQIDVAERLGFASADRISHWEKGQAYPSVENMAKLCELYGTSFERIYPGLFGNATLHKGTQEPALQINA